MIKCTVETETDKQTASNSKIVFSTTIVCCCLVVALIRRVYLLNTLAKKLGWVSVFFATGLNLVTQATLTYEYVSCSLATQPINRVAEICDWRVSITTYLYILNAMCCYGVLWFRANSVLSKFVKDKWITCLKLAVGLGTTMAPLFMLLAWITGKYRVSDTTLSLGYLILFLYPLGAIHKILPTASNLGGMFGENIKVLLNVAKRNYKWSVLTISVTFIAIGLGAVSEFVVLSIGATDGAILNSFYVVGAITVDMGVKQLAVFAIANYLPRTRVQNQTLKKKPCNAVALSNHRLFESSVADVTIS